ncbi:MULTISPECIES: GTPase Era [unclassified Devosia]|uniref:GTPase Era n=1 Tax=unclassified Devosia TaxID=196773 RepID=UPI00145DC34C|nr:MULTISPECIES: GTPase Era [unclassified Devosia]MBJ6986813.1 GTPase Era [Devosia sp. MC521]MBJ7576746.1 GTPase Era [Devosia sp. MC532]MBK1795648.1 GTPase Era [Devosia sp. WQ 349K1]QMW63848.1 GTPase Era [Devosia sp. MC521]
MTQNIEMTDTACGFIALVGAPNAGKSTLLNSLVGTKVSIVTHKAQTTRSQVRGVLTLEQTQLVFVDTPGVFQPKRRLDRAMVDSAWGGAGDADIVAFIVDAERGITSDIEALIEGLKNINHPKVLILNKIDQVQREKLLHLAHDLNEHLRFEATFMLSALKGDGVKDFIDWAAKHVPPGPWHFPEDHLTDLTMAITAAEVTREKLFLRVHDEIPYNSTVETESFKIQKDGSYKIDQVIYLSRESHKKIVLGAGGQTIKAIGADSRRELMDMYEVPIHLFLFVKVREKWAEDPERYQEMGLEFPSDKK